LDEIEAALDEVNAQRFANFIQDYSQNIQFIIITHRRPTMEVAGALYGVSMVERGVSKLISVQLDEKTG
jgi:chromosome segregation protein